MKYSEPQPVERAAAEKILAGDNDFQICETLVGMALHEADASWVQSVCMQFAELHPSLAVRTVSCTCLGHLARIHRDSTILSAKPLLEGLLNNPEISGYADDALSDIEVFVERPPRRRRK